MSDPNPDLQAEQEATLKNHRQAGCLKLFLIGFISCVALLIITLVTIDKLNMGGKIKSNLKEVFGKTNSSSPAEPRVVEKRVEVPVEKIVEKVVEVEVLPPLAKEYVSWRKIDTARLWSGVRVENTVDAAQGELASLEREKEDAIQVDLKLTFKIPKASQTMTELTSVNEHLEKMLPGLKSMLTTAEVSPFYHQLYENKTRLMQQNVTRLDKLLSVHNLYDTQTILELEDEATEQKVLLVQSDMDVVSDGSDGDRWPFLDNYISMSSSYQPFTSYGWAKQTTKPNPLLKRWEDELKVKSERFKVKGLSIEENRSLRSSITRLEGGVKDMKARSYLIAEADPFIVMSLVFFDRIKESEYAPVVGDYAAVIHGDKIYPAIFGDYGPSYKMGEASLRIAKQLNPKASPYSRPESDLEVTYLVFPRSREEKKGPPNLELWHSKCQELIGNIGGLGDGYTLHQWEDIIPVKLDEWRRKNDPDYILELKKKQAEQEAENAPTSEEHSPETPEESGATAPGEGN